MDDGDDRGTGRGGQCKEHEDEGCDDVMRLCLFLLLRACEVIIIIVVGVRARSVGLGTVPRGDEKSEIG